MRAVFGILIVMTLAVTTGCMSPGAAGMSAAASAESAAVGGVPGVAGAAAPAAAATPNLWSFLLPSHQKCMECKQKFCQSGLGQLFGSMLAPMGMLTGGLIGSPCPGPNDPNLADLAMPADSAQGAAARIKADEANAKARAEAMKYLGTVDCRYYPEASAALINGLRADKNECVRIEAAKSLLNGCCCNKQTIEALTISVNGDDKDGNPGERSECVRALAFLALQNCLATYQEPSEPPEPGTPAPKEAPKKDGPATKQASATEPAEADGEQKAETERPTEEVIAEARATLAKGLNVSRATLSRIQGQISLKEIALGQPSVNLSHYDVVVPAQPEVEQPPQPMPATKGPIQPASHFVPKSESKPE